MARALNFNPGPAALPLAALERAAREFVDYGGTGMSIMEHSHRGKAYEAVHNEAIALVRELLGVSDAYHVLLLQGGATGQFAMVPMNLLAPGKSADYTLTGSWSKGAYKHAKALGSVRAAANVEVDGKFVRMPRPAELDLDPNAAYLHITSNETIAGTQWSEFPDAGAVPLVADMSSDIMWRPLDVNRFGIIYAGAQKNLGPSGVTVVIARKDLVDGARTDLPPILQYRTHADANSLSNTPPTFAIYMLRNVLAWLKESGGLAAAERRNREKASLLYAAIDARPDMYRCPVERDFRSVMNVVFTLPTPELEAEFLEGAKKRNMIGLKGHRSVGGMRASIYNAAPVEWIQALCDFMADFHKGA
jgi:phosphoserine aminotransferase